MTGDQNLRHLLAAALLSLVAGIACSSARYGATESGQPTVTFPARYGPTQDGGIEKPGAEVDPEGDEPAAYSSAPDPVPLRTPLQWEYRLRYRRGEILVEQVRALRFDQPVVTARTMGRFAIELWIGSELVERVRFEFPLLAADPPPPGRRTPLHAPPNFSAGADVEATVLVPRSERATRAMLVDRANGYELALPWPPGTTEAAPEAAPDAGPARPPDKSQR